MTQSERQSGIDRLQELVSARVGIIRSLSPVVRGVDEPKPPFIFQAMLSHFDFRKAKAWERVAAGKGLTEEDAIRGAIGEAIEHYCASHFEASATLREKWNNLRTPAVTPPECVLYSDSQYARPSFPYHRWNPEDELTWRSMRELPSGNEVLAPAALVYLTSPGPHPEDLLCPATSNGLAAGPDVDSAVLHGLYELVERDAFLITWMNHLPVPEIDFSTAEGLAGSIPRHYARFGIKVRVFNLSMDLPVYTMMALAIDASGESPAALVGLGCHLDPRIALTKALLEICQIRPGESRRYRDEPPAERLKRYQDVRTLEDHSAFASIPERLGEFSFLLENCRHQRLTDLPDRSQGTVRRDLDHCVNVLVNAGCRVMYADLTTPDIVEYPLCVVRTLATGLQPMHFGYGEERLGGRRLYEVPRALGYAPQVRSESELNPCPHPIA